MYIYVPNFHLLHADLPTLFYGLSVKVRFLGMWNSITHGYMKKLWIFTDKNVRFYYVN